MTSPTRHECPACLGSGVLWECGERCTCYTCNGKGWVSILDAPTITLRARELLTRALTGRVIPDPKDKK